MNKKERVYRFETETPSEYVARERQMAVSALGLMTGETAKNTVMALLRKDFRAARKALEFEEEVNRLLAPELTPEEYCEFVASLLWESGDGISAEQFLVQVKNIQKSVENGEFQDLETVFKLHRDKLRKNHPGFIFD